MPETPSKTLPPEYFDEVYAANADPWQFASSPYEKAKYADTLAHLQRARYTRGFEIGCSIGVLTAHMAERCDELLSVDVSERALQQARTRCAHLRQVRLRRMQVPKERPEGQFDLIVVSEVGYYWSSADLDGAIALLAEHHQPGGHLLLVHWTPRVHDYPLTGDVVHDLWQARPEWRTVSDESRDQYRISVLERVT